MTYNQPLFGALLTDQPVAFTPPIGSGSGGIGGGFFMPPIGSGSGGIGGG